MLSITLAKRLKDAGLAWTPEPRDFFAVPDRGLDDHIFVINFMTVGIGMMSGHPVVTFHGVTESPLDYIPLAEAVWLPSESQLRTVLEEHLISEGQPALSLTSTNDGYRCEIQFHGDSLSFEAFGVDEVYGLALLHVIEHQ